MAARSAALLLLWLGTADLAAAGTGSLRGAAPSPEAASPPANASLDATTSAAAPSALNATVAAQAGAGLAAQAAAGGGLAAKANAPPFCYWMPWHPACQHFASCATYGCGTYGPWNMCQCNDACGSYGNCCSDYSSTCGAQPPARPPASTPEPSEPEPTAAPSGPVLTLYHQTSPELGATILQEGFKPGTEGWCGGGIYFATTAADTYKKAIGPESHQGYIIQAQVSLGRVKQMSSTCDRSMTGAELEGMGYDSIKFNPGDGMEYVVYDGSRVVSMRHYQ